VIHAQWVNPLVNLQKIIDLMSECQLYKYNASFYAIEKDEANHFVNDFVESEIDSDYVSWLNFHSLSDRESIEKICLKLGVEKLSIEGIYNAIRRPKVEEYPDYMFFSVKSALPDLDDISALHQEQITFILGRNYLISFQEKASDHFLDVRDRIEKGRGKIRSKGTDFLLFRMLEAIIDNYFEVLETISDNIALIDAKLHVSENKSIFKEIEIEKRRLIELRKIVQPMRDITMQLEHSESNLLDRTNFYYFSNLKSACLSALEEIDANKQILEGMSNLFYAAQGQRMNEIMKMLTVVSSLFIPLTFIVGVYGMNFEFMPELKWKSGYFIIWGVMFAIIIGMFIYFTKKGWLKRDKF
jgi:magnesium transporter